MSHRNWLFIVFLLTLGQHGCTSETRKTVVFEPSWSLDLPVSSIFSMDMAPDQRSVVIVGEGGGVFWLDLLNTDVIRRVDKCKDAMPGIVWSSDSTLFVVHDYPDRFQGTLRLIDSRSLLELSSTDVAFITSLSNAGPNRIICFVESGSQFSSESVWKPVLYDFSAESGFVPTGVIPTEDALGLGKLLAPEYPEIMLCTTGNARGNVEAWQLTTDHNAVPQDVIAKSISITKPEIPNASGIIALEEIAVGVDGSLVAALWRKDHVEFGSAEEYVTFFKIEHESDSLVISTSCVSPSLYFRFADSLHDFPEITHRLCFVCEDQYLALATGEGIRICDSKSGEWVGEYALEGCITLCRGQTPHEILASSDGRVETLTIREAP